MMKPKPVSGVDMAFGPKDVNSMMPKYSDIPDEFKSGHTKWNSFFNDMFYKVIKSYSATPKDGIDKADALRHFSAVARSFEPKHEHKEAACAYLLSLWFDDITWEAAK